jgi:hypothetical protein
MSAGLPEPISAERRLASSNFDALEFANESAPFWFANPHRTFTHSCSKSVRSYVKLQA